MKKRLQFLFLAIICTVAVKAADYVYSHTGRYVVNGENLLTNGNFANGTDNWKTETGEVLNNQIWSVDAQAGPNGANALISLDATGGEGTAAVQTVNNLFAGLYAITYYIKGESDGQKTSITKDAANYVNVFSNAGGSLTDVTIQVAAVEQFGSEWTRIVNIVDVPNNNSLVIYLAKLATGTMMADFQIFEVSQVFDDRIAERQIAYTEKLLADENLTKGKEDLEEVLGSLRQLVANDNHEELASLMSSYDDDVISEYLKANGANLFPTYLQDWTSWGKYNYAKLATKDNWTFEGGRWGFTGNEEYLEFAKGDGYIASAGIQRDGIKYTINAAVRTRDDKLNDLPAGKYFFSIEAQAVASANRANPYGSDHSVVIANPYFFIGTDTITITDTISGYYWKTFYAIGEIKEGDKKVLGFHFPVVNGTGGRYSVRNPKAYLLGSNTEDMEFEAQKAAFIVQQFNLNKRITEYPVELNTTAYPWEQDSLARAIAEAQPVYENSLTIIDVEGNVLNEAQVTEANTQKLLDQVNALGRARNFVITQNSPIATLKNAVDAANTVLNDPVYAGATAGNRQALQDAIAQGQNLLDNINSTNQGEAFTAATADILAAQEVFQATSASRANPTAILIKNADFSDFAAGNNITTFDGPTKDWYWSVAASASRWEIRDNETLSQGHGASIWRGTTAALDGKAQQTVELSYEGLYEYRAEAYISEERVNELVAAAEVLEKDTVFTPNIRLFFGEEGKPDSVTISKWYNGVKGDGTYFTRDVSGTKYSGIVYATYSVYFKKTGSTPVTVEFGFEANGNSATAGANGFGFGNNRVYYVGDETQYLTDTRADLNTAVNYARSLAQSNPDSYWTVKLNRYINDAEQATTAKQMQNALWGISEVSSRLSGVTTGISEMMSQNALVKKQHAEGIYTLTGVRLAASTKALPRGMYIINGRKYVVK